MLKMAEDLIKLPIGFALLRFMLFVCCIPTLVLCFDKPDHEALAILRKTNCRTDTHLNFVGKPADNRERTLNYCFEHVTNTCCSMYHTTIILNKMAEIKNSTRIQDSCYQTTRNVYCSGCDGYLGIGYKQDYCPSYCSLWYEKCNTTLFYYQKEINIETEQQELTKLEFCKNTQPEYQCKQLIDIIPPEKYEQFCNSMGIFVNTNEETCYKGIPAGFIDPLNAIKKPTKGLWLWSWSGLFSSIGKYMMYLSIILTMIFGMWCFNRNQRNRLEFNKELDQKKKEKTKKKQ